MTIKYRANLCAGIASIVFAVILWYLIPLQIGTEYSKTYGITSRTTPHAIAFIFVVCGALLIFQSLVLKKDVVRKLEVKKELKALGYMLVFLIYALIFQKSFIVSTAFLGVATLAFTGSKKKLYYAIVIIFVALLYLVFTQALHVELPQRGV